MMRWALLLSLCCLGADCEQDRLDGLDNGRMTLDDGTEMHPYLTPWYVTWDDSIDDDFAMDAIEWWNEQAGVEVFEVEAWSFSAISIEANLLPEDVAGVFRDNTYDDGRISSGDIVISADIMYDYDYSQAALRHEMGHALGLADDPHSIDLNSIMSSPLIVGGELTDHDRSLVVD